MSSASKIYIIDKLADIDNQCNNTYHSTIKMKLLEVKSSTYIDFNVGNQLRISKNTIFFQTTKFQIGEKILK